MENPGLTNCLREMLTNTHKRREMGERARLRVRQYFSADVLYQALRSRYLAMAKDKGLLIEGGER